MKLLIFLLLSSFFFFQNGLAETENLRDSRSIGIPSLNRMIQSKEFAKKEQESKKQLSALQEEKQQIVSMTSLENELIVQIFKQAPNIDSEGNLNKDNKQRYYVVEPLTSNLSIFLGSSDKEKGIIRYKNIWTERLHPEQVDISHLVDSFFSRNKMQARLGIKSSKSDGFLVDYENSKNDIFEKKDGGGWKGFYSAHPNSYGISTISIPAYDDKMKLVLVYRSLSGGSLYGSGWIFLYSYADGQIKLLRKRELWRS